MRNHRRKTDGLALVATLLLLLADVAAAATTPHADIRDTARLHALADAENPGGRIEVSVGDLDSRLRLAQCDQQLEAFDSPNGLRNGRGVVGVRCNGSKPWKLYVPVQIATFETIVVTRRPVVRGQSLGRNDVTLEESDTSQLHKAYFTRVEDVVGLRTKRALAAGKPIYAGVLKREQLVRRGSTVEIIADTGGLLVTMRGKALADGGRGDRIRVENSKSGRVVTGTVSGRGIIHVTELP